MTATAINGQAELSRNGTTWEHDLAIAYRRIGSQN
jgi:hypothetical protein